MEYFDLVKVGREISKAEFISFLIGYFRCTEPTLRVVRYLAEFNCLRIEYVNRQNKIRTVMMQFGENYVIKDEEVSMIIEKGKLKNTVVSLEGMSITDGFLIFLANCDKMLNIYSLNISHCPRITDSGTPPSN